MDPGFAQRTKGIVDDAIVCLSKPAGPAGLPQYFFVVSRRTRFIVNLELAPHPSVDLDDLLLAIHDFLESQTALENGNIYLTRLKDISILIEPFGDVLFAEAFDNTVDRSRYKEFHRAVRQVQKSYPDLGAWDGSPQALPDGFREFLRSLFGQPQPAVEPAAAGPGAPAAPARPPRPEPEGPPADAAARRPSIGHGPEPDIQDCERKMREWYKRGLKINKLKDALHRDWATIVRTFEEYERDLARLEKLRARLEGFKSIGFDGELRRLASMLNDPGAIREIEKQFAALAGQIKDRYTLKLPVTDPDRLAEAVKSLPLGIPSALWGIPLDTLVDEFLSAEKGASPDGSVVVSLRGAWYVADPASPDFLAPFSGQVRSQKEMFPPGTGVDRLDDMLAEMDETAAKRTDE